MEQWLEVGCAAVPCTCSCLPDGVALDMGIFLPELREGSSGGCTTAHSVAHDASVRSWGWCFVWALVHPPGTGGVGKPGGPGRGHMPYLCPQFSHGSPLMVCISSCAWPADEEEDSEEDSEEEESEEEEEEERPATRRRTAAGAAAGRSRGGPAGAGRGRKAAAADSEGSEEEEEEEGSDEESEDGEESGSDSGTPARPAPKRRRGSAAALKPMPMRPATRVPDVVKATRVRKTPGQAPWCPAPCKVLARCCAWGLLCHGVLAVACQRPDRGAASVLGRHVACRSCIRAQLPTVLCPAHSQARRAPRTAGTPEWGKLAEDRPLAVVERDEQTRQVCVCVCVRAEGGCSHLGRLGGGSATVLACTLLAAAGSLPADPAAGLHPPAPRALQLKFSLCHRLDRPSSKPGAMWVGVLRAGDDGLFRCGGWVGLGGVTLAPPILVLLSWGCAAQRVAMSMCHADPGRSAPIDGSHTARPPPCVPRRRPQGAPKLLQLGVQYPRVVRVRAEWQPPEGRKRAGGWALKTKQERILMDV